jgi:Primosomal protein N'' (replication factor Y) - superfamily II helicase
MKSQVLLPKIFNFPFTYNSRIENKIGNLVEVPFGSKKEIGVIWKNNYTEPENIKIKYINKRTEYSIDRKLIDFIEWFSTYNMVPIGLVLKMAIGGSDNLIKNKDNSLEIKKTKTRYFRLNHEQISALKFLEKVNNKFDVSVLQGTTGSGKTLVYFERIKKIIEKNQQVLVLLPRNFFNEWNSNQD